MDNLQVGNAIKYETVSIFLHATWSYAWMWFWELPFGWWGRFLSGASVAIFLAGNEMSTLRQVNNLQFHAARAVWAFFMFLICCVVMGIACPVPLDYSAGKLEKAKKECIYGYHYIAHLGIMAELRAILSLSSFLVWLAWWFLRQLGRFLYNSITFTYTD